MPSFAWEELNSKREQYTTVILPDRAAVLEKLVREAVGLFNDGLNIGLGWVARAERVLGEDE